MNEADCTKAFYKKFEENRIGFEVGYLLFTTIGEMILMKRSA